SYITEYSYAKLETFNLFIPRFMGGGTVEELDQDSNFYKLIDEKAGKKVADQYSKQVLLYWGDQPIVEAPAYIGSVIFFLFFLGIFLVKGRIKQWLVAATAFSIVMSWGKNFDVLTNFFIDYVPLYNKFRAVSSIQVIAELCVPVLAVLGLSELFSSNSSTTDKYRALKKALYTFGGLVLVGLFLAHSFSTFEGLRDSQYNQLPGLIDAVIADRKSMLLQDSFRSLFLIFISAVVLYLFLKNKIKQAGASVFLIILVLFDLISINKKYVNQDDFKSTKKIEIPFIASEADKLILKDKAHFRVGNFTINPMNDGSTSYFHQSIGGYHAAKMMRYQELYDYQIAKNNREVLNMLNTKYFIIGTDKGEKKAQLNPEANGNAWFVKRIQVVNSANEAIFALDTLNTKTVAVLESVPDILNDYESLFNIDALSSIKLLNYDVASLTYLSKTVRDQFAVFSEIYYEDGWNAYVDGKLVPHYRVNYVLRGMIIPKGEHTIEFKFEPKVIQRGKIISLFSYLLLIGLPLIWFFITKNKK
ncbi:MAG: YfhO family protein, partial [Polaribacter sp.]|nr:YfhO family protein [Polaribacter sp.]